MLLTLWAFLCEIGSWHTLLGLGAGSFHLELVLRVCKEHVYPEESGLQCIYVYILTYIHAYMGPKGLTIQSLEGLRMYIICIYIYLCT